ncbi:hypothetical protein [Actinoplanes regularis]|uniref:hypothetical protein n=1 Tax=Actinoplanes regularis TaxID=52697 RepID=UPI0024A2DB24|nr:hypothetical protein [Actinoplanes regularis]GLW27484.1 hypothetical protein Areg01_04250 [Actinoplanes regularis]
MTRHRWPAIVTGLSGCLLLATLPASADYGMPMLPAAGSDYYYGMPAVMAPIVIGPSVAAIVLALRLLRWWPYQLLVAVLLGGPQSLVESRILPKELAGVLFLSGPLVRSFALIGVLACAQSLWRGGAPRWGAVTAGLALGSRLFFSALVGNSGSTIDPDADHWRLGLITLATFGLLAFCWRVEPEDRMNADPVTGEQGPARSRLPLVAGLALFLVIPLAMVSQDSAAGLLGIDSGTLQRHLFIRVALAGVASLVVAVGIAALAGKRSLGGMLALAVAQAALAAPLLMAYFALQDDISARLWGVLAGVAIGVAAVAGRWRPAAAGALCVAAAVALFAAQASPAGPEPIATRHLAVPALVILALVSAAGTAVAGAIGTVLAPLRSVPAVFGPLAGLIASGLLQVLEVTYLGSDGRPADDALNSVRHLAISGVLLLVVAAAVAALGFWRRAAVEPDDQIRAEAAEAERDRLARPIHDGALQVLALVQRQGPDPELAEEAAEQEAALRRLLTDRDRPGR